MRICIVLHVSETTCLCLRACRVYIRVYACQCVCSKCVECECVCYAFESVNSVCVTE